MKKLTVRDRMNRRRFLASVPLALLYVRTGQALAQMPAAAGLRALADKKSFRFGSAIDLQNINDQSLPRSTSTTSIR